MSECACVCIFLGAHIFFTRCVCRVCCVCVSCVYSARSLHLLQQVPCLCVCACVCARARVPLTPGAYTPTSSTPRPRTPPTPPPHIRISRIAVPSAEPSPAPICSSPPSCHRQHTETASRSHAPNEPAVSCFWGCRDKLNLNPKSNPKSQTLACRGTRATKR